MDRKIDTTIQFSGLKTGTYEYNFVLDSAFFRAFENEDLSDGMVDFDVKMERKTNILLFTFSFHGKVNTVCDRCLDPLEVSVEGTQMLCVKLTDDPREEETAEVSILPTSAFEVDLGQWMYEFVVMALPMVKVHPDNPDGTSTCNPEMLERLSSLVPETDEVDPRWAVLSQLKEKE